MAMAGVRFLLLVLFLDFAFVNAKDQKGKISKNKLGANPFFGQSAIWPVEELTRKKRGNMWWCCKMVDCDSLGTILDIAKATAASKKDDVITWNGPTTAYVACVGPDVPPAPSWSYEFWVDGTTWVTGPDPRASSKHSQARVLNGVWKQYRGGTWTFVITRADYKSANDVCKKNHFKYTQASYQNLWYAFETAEQGQVMPVDTLWNPAKKL